MLQDNNWEIILSFIQSKKFKSLVPYANEGSAEKRLKTVAEGYIALYATAKHPIGIHILPSVINEQGRKASEILLGYWENKPNQPLGDSPRTICKMEPVEGERYTKFAYVALFRSKQISATGLVIYLNSEELPDHDYCHTFVLQVWRRRDPETGSNMPAELTYLTLKENQPKFSISSVLNNYFYKDSDPIASRGGVTYSINENNKTGEQSIKSKLPMERTFRWAFNSTAGNTIILKKSKNPIPEENEIIDQLLEDVLPHGYTEA